MLFFNHLEMKKMEIQNLKCQGTQKQNDIALQVEKIKNIGLELMDLERVLFLCRDCDLEKGRKVALEISSDLKQIKEIRLQISETSVAYDNFKQDGSRTDRSRGRLVLGGSWYSLSQQLQNMDAQVLQKKKQINGFLVLCEKVKCQATHMTDQVREQYLKSYQEMIIQPCLDRQRELTLGLETLQREELTIAQALQNETQALSKQYRKAAYLMVGLAVSGISVASVVATLISAWALYILTLSTVPAGMAAWRGQYFFQEGKKYEHSSAYLINILLSC